MTQLRFKSSHNLLTTIILFLISLINVISASEFEIHVDKQANSMVVLQVKISSKNIQYQ